MLAAPYGGGEQDYGKTVEMAGDALLRLDRAGPAVTSDR
jgi:hypothetical protein